MRVFSGVDSIRDLGKIDISYLVKVAASATPNAGQELIPAYWFNPDQSQDVDNVILLSGGNDEDSGRITGCAMLAGLLVAHASPGSAQGDKMSDVADQLRKELAGHPVTVTQQGPVTLTSGADAMFPSGGWELKPGVPVLSKIVPILSKLQHTEIVVGGYTDNAPVGQQLQSAGIANNLDLSCKRAASVVSYLVSQGVNPNLLSAQCFGATHPVGPNDTPEGQSKNRRVDITLSGDGT